MRSHSENFKEWNTERYSSHLLWSGRDCRWRAEARTDTYKKTTDNSLLSLPYTSGGRAAGCWRAWGRMWRSRTSWRAPADTARHHSLPAGLWWPSPGRTGRRMQQLMTRNTTFLTDTFIFTHQSIPSHTLSLLIFFSRPSYIKNTVILRQSQGLGDIYLSEFVKYSNNQHLNLCVTWKYSKTHFRSSKLQWNIPTIKV